jgi:hypothetical protein
MDKVRQLITDKLAEKRLTMKDASLAVGRAHSFLYQFLKKGQPSELREVDRLKLAEVLGISDDDLRGPSTRISHDKKSTGTRQSFVDENTQRPHSGTAGVKSAPAAQLVASTELYGLQADLPVFSTSESGASAGALVVSEVAVDWVARPAALLRVRDAYGLIVSDDTMSPEHKPGSIALVHPHLPPRVGDSCVFRSHAEGKTVAVIREYRGATETHWKVRQHNPQRDLTLKRSDWPVMHRTIGNYFP